MKVLKQFSLFLAILMLVGAFSSCALFEKPSDEELKEVLEDLLPPSKELTEIIYGEGIEIDESYQIDPNWTTAHYAPVARGFKYQTIDDLKVAIRAVFSENYSEEIFEYAFVSNDDYMSRFGENDKGKLTMDVTKEPFSVASDIYIETARVTSGNSYACVVLVEMSSDGGKTRYEETLRLVKENDKWKFDGPTY